MGIRVGVGRHASSERGLLTANRVYKTGDVVRWLDDGSLLYLGRMDDQVSIPLSLLPSWPEDPVYEAACYACRSSSVGIVSSWGRLRTP
jgi:hypothetical protein